MNLTFNQFLEQRDPELYNQMLNEGMFDFVGKAAAGIGNYAGKGIEKVKKFFNPLLLMADVKKNGEKIDALRNAGWWGKKPEEVERLIKDNIDKLQKIREHGKWAKENPKSFSKAVNDFSKIVRSAAAAGVISIGLVGLWNAQSVQDNKFDDTYKGDTSGYVAKPSAAAETPTPEAEPTEAPTVQSQGSEQGGRQRIFSKIAQRLKKGGDGPVARLADKVDDLRGGDGPIINMVHNFQNKRDGKGGIAKRIGNIIRGGR
jgi:hypothetical protein